MTCAAGSATALVTKRRHDAAMAATCDIDTMVKIVYVWSVVFECRSDRDRQRIDD
jgi:hypothetical protein